MVKSYGEMRNDAMTPLADRGRRQPRRHVAMRVWLIKQLLINNCVSSISSHARQTTTTWWQRQDARQRREKRTVEIEV